MVFIGSREREGGQGQLCTMSTEYQLFFLMASLAMCYQRSPFTTYAVISVWLYALQVGESTLEVQSDISKYCVRTQWIFPGQKWICATSPSKYTDSAYLNIVDGASEYIESAHPNNVLASAKSKHLLFRPKKIPQLGTLKTLPGLRKQTQNIQKHKQKQHFGQNWGYIWTPHVQYGLLKVCCPLWIVSL